MARSSYQKLKPLYIMKYLLQNTDEDHPVNLTEEQRSFAKERKAEIHEKHRRAVLRLLQLAEVPPAGPAKSPIEFLQFLAPPKARREAPCMPL